MPKTTIKDLGEVLERVQAQLAELSERVAKLEATRSVTPAEESFPAPITTESPKQSAAAKPEITEEELIAISAALGAYLGVRVRIKQIRLLTSRAWAQQGRVSIQASHYLHN
jgi:methylmalonyl-CoA carboxyltransferase large subunit